jgi:hypothetical protein
MAPREPFDHLRAGAERPFPDEVHWLSARLPADAADDGLPSPGFVDRVVQALGEERALDRDLLRLSRELPRSLLGAFQPPPPRRDFVERTVAAVEDERRARWQRLLARHVAPEPSPEFVARTLAALRAADHAPLPTRAAPARRWPRMLAWPLAAAAAAALWFAGASGEPQPALEARLADGAPPGYAYAYAATPVAVLLASRARTNDPDALFTAAADGVWLSLGDGR